MKRNKVLINLETLDQDTGRNKNIKGHILSSSEMMKHRFHFVKDRWHLTKRLIYDITMDVDILPTGEVIIDVLDDDFLQPYDFQQAILNDCTITLPYQVLILARGELLRLRDAGIISNWNYSDYI